MDISVHVAEHEGRSFTLDVWSGVQGRSPCAGDQKWKQAIALCQYTFYSAERLRVSSQILGN